MIICLVAHGSPPSLVGEKLDFHRIEFKTSIYLSPHAGTRNLPVANLVSNVLLGCTRHTASLIDLCFGFHLASAPQISSRLALQARLLSLIYTVGNPSSSVVKPIVIKTAQPRLSTTNERAQPWSMRLKLTAPHYCYYLSLLAHWSHAASPLWTS